MQQFKREFATIKGLSEKRRFPRLNKVRLGIKKISQKSGKEYPAEVDYFVVPPEVEKVYGSKPKELDVMFPVDDHETIFPTAYKYYGSSKGLKCIGNGETARRVNEETGVMEERTCTCDKLDKKECNKRAHLMFILPKVNMGGVYQCDVGSYNSIVDINSGLSYTQALLGRFAMVPLKLKREPIETHHDGKRQTHYTLKIYFDGDINLLNALRENTKRVLIEAERNVLPPPKDENPEMDNGATIVPEAELDEPEKATPAPRPVLLTRETFDKLGKPEMIQEIKNTLVMLKLTEKDIPTPIRLDSQSKHELKASYLVLLAKHESMQAEKAEPMKASKKEECVECPELEGVKIDINHCNTKCETRKGCPSWGSEGANKKEATLF